MILILSQSHRGNKITPKNELGVDVSLGLWREEMFWDLLSQEYFFSIFKFLTLKRREKESLERSDMGLPSFVQCIISLNTKTLKKAYGNGGIKIKEKYNIFYHWLPTYDANHLNP